MLTKHFYPPLSQHSHIWAAFQSRFHWLQIDPQKRFCRFPHHRWQMSCLPSVWAHPNLCSQSRFWFDFDDKDTWNKIKNARLLKNCYQWICLSYWSISAFDAPHRTNMSVWFTDKQWPAVTINWLFAMNPVQRFSTSCPFPFGHNVLITSNTTQG